MANQITVTSGTGNIQVTTSRTVIGISNVANANTANYAANVTGNAQPNITSLGTLTGLTSSGNITAPFFIGNVVGNISGNIVVPGTNTSILFNQLGNAGASDALQFDYSANVLTVTGNANVTGKLTLGGNIQGNLLPQANGTQDIGSNTQRWNDLYLNGNTIYLGSQTLESNATHTIISGVLSANGAGITNVNAASVAVANVTGIGNIATVNLDGNTSNVLRGDGSFAPEGSSGNANYANFAGTAFSVSGSNVSGAVANATYANSANTANSATVAASANSVAGANVSGTVANATYATSAGTANSATVAASANSVAGANVTGQVNFAAVANSVAGANVSGTVANATYAANAGNANTANSATVAASANSVAVANVTGIGNIATLNLDGNAGNILYGNGIFAAVPNVSNVANANYANFAGTAYSVSGANVSGEVANANYASFSNIANSANSVAGANVSGTVANANYASFSNIANSANSVAGANVSGTVANATYAANAGHATTANTVTDNAQPNITSVGTLGNLAVSGNITANVITANYINANVNFGNVDSIQFDTAANVTLANVGQLAWDDGDGTLQLLMKGGNVTQQIGTQEYARVYNDEATTLNKGEVVYINGAQGNRVSVKRARADSETTSIGTIGFVAESIAAGAEGFIIVSGALYKLNTNGLVAGGAVYLSPSVSGGYTQTKPVAPNQLVILGWIERVSATVGSIYVKVDNGYELDELHNVLITSPTAGQALVYNSSNLWVNGNPNVANSALSVAGANVVGEVANANFASFSNVANSANAVAGANVSGTVANANYASYANIANSANSVAVANVSGIGNIATVNLDGNASNILYGNGSFAAPAAVNNVANANYANFAGTVITNAQPNITSTGNLVSLTIDNGVANTPIYQFNGNGVALPNGAGNVEVLTSTGISGIVEAKLGKNFDGSNGFNSATNYYVNDGTNTYLGIKQSAFQYGTPGTVAVPGLFSVTVPETTSNLNTSSTGTHSLFQVGQGGFLAVTGSQINAPSMGVFNYGNTTQSQASGLRFNRRRGNGDVRSNVAGNDYLGNIEWRAAGTGTGTLNSRIVTFGAKVDSSYGGPGNVMPIGFEIDVVNSSNTFIAHNFWANGNVTFSNTVIATAFSGNGAALTSITGANVTGTVANATYATSAGSATTATTATSATSANTANTVTDNAQPNITSVGTLSNLNFTGNITGANSNIVLDNGNGVGYFKQLNIQTSFPTKTTIYGNGTALFGEGNISLYSNGTIVTTTLNSTDANITATTKTKYIEQNLGSTNLTPGNTLSLAANVEQYYKVTLTSGTANSTSTIDCANLDTASIGKTYKFLVFNNSGGNQTVQTSGLAQVNPSTLIQNNRYGMLYVDLHGTDGSGVWIWSNLA